MSIRIEGQWENDRNSEHSELYKAIIREVFGVKDVIIAHHLVYVLEETRADGFHYQIVEEIPSADTMIFDHEIAKKLWPDDWQRNLTLLAMQPCESRDALLHELFYNRKTVAESTP